MNAKKWCAIAVIVSVAVGAAQGAWVFDTLNNTKTITFQEMIPNVLGYNATVSYGTIRETYNANFTDQLILRSLAWSVRASGVDIAGNGAGNWTPFAAEISNPPNTWENHFGVPGHLAVRSSYDPPGSGTWYSTSLLPAGERAWAFGGGWLDHGATLRVLNNTGQTVPQWNFSMDLYHRDNDNMRSDFVLSYSTDNSSYTTLWTFQGYNTGGNWTPNLAPSVTINASIADGAYLYIRMESLRPGGTGSGGIWLFDNISLTAVPEPATFTVLLSAGVVLIASRRMQRR
jgi:hypothetical protein